MNKSQKINEAKRLFQQVYARRNFSAKEYWCCIDAIERDPTGALRCYRAILASYGGNNERKSAR